jgi:hypothetical protein
MSSNHAVSDFSLRSAVTEPQVKTMARSGEYAELVRQLFYRRTAVAVVSSGFSVEVGNCCESIASELAAAGKSVVVVLVDSLLRSDSLRPYEEAVFATGKTPNVWVWLWAAGMKAGFPMENMVPLTSENWLTELRRNFDAVLLDCSAVESVLGVTAVAAMADAAVLAVEAGRTSKHQIQRDQRVLQMGGVKLAACILIRRR